MISFIYIVPRNSLIAKIFVQKIGHCISPANYLLLYEQNCVTNGTDLLMVVKFRTKSTFLYLNLRIIESFILRKYFPTFSCKIPLRSYTAYIRITIMMLGIVKRWHHFKTMNEIPLSPFFKLNQDCWIIFCFMHC